MRQATAALILLVLATGAAAAPCRRFVAEVR
jgi:hypothetical protein